MEYKCNICVKLYKSYQSLWNHNYKYHQHELHQNTPTIHIDTVKKIHICEFCNQNFSRSDSLKRHISRCKNHQTIKMELQELKSEIKTLKTETIQKTMLNNINNSNINNGNIINNNQKIVINKTGSENIDSLTYNEVSIIFDNEITSVIKLIEHLNFNERKPENHSFCSTALESPYLSFYNTETNTINKERKKYFYEDIICKHIANHEILYSKFKHKFNLTKRKQIEENIYNLKQIRDNSYNNKIMHEIIRKLNLVSYNNRELIQDTWNGKTYENESDEEFMKIILDDPGKKDSDNNSCASSSSDDSSSDDYSLRRRY